MDEVNKGLRSRMTERAVARSFKGKNVPVSMKFKPIEPGKKLEGPGSMRGQMDPTTHHRVGKSAFFEDVEKSDKKKCPHCGQAMPGSY